jgi:serine protease Do
VARVVPQLREHGKVERPWLGVGLKDLPEDRSQMFFPVESGVLVAQVDGEGPARVAGLREGDVILSLDGKAVKSAHDLIMAIGDRKVGATVQLEVSRSGQRKAVSIKLGQMPQRLMTSAGQEPTEEMPQDQGE